MIEIVIPEEKEQDSQRSRKIAEAPERMGTDGLFPVWGVPEKRARRMIRMAQRFLRSKNPESHLIGIVLREMLEYFGFWPEGKEIE